MRTSLAHLLGERPRSAIDVDDGAAGCVNCGTLTSTSTKIATSAPSR